MLSPAAWPVQLQTSIAVPVRAVRLLLRLSRLFIAKVLCIASDHMRSNWRAEYSITFRVESIVLQTYFLYHSTNSLRHSTQLSTPRFNCSSSHAVVFPIVLHPPHLAGDQNHLGAQFRQSNREPFKFETPIGESDRQHRLERRRRANRESAKRVRNRRTQHLEAQVITCLVQHYV